MSKIDEFTREYFKFQEWVGDFEKNYPDVAKIILNEMGIVDGKRRWRWSPGVITLEYKTWYVNIPDHMLEIQSYDEPGVQIEERLRSFLSDHPRHPSMI